MVSYDFAVKQGQRGSLCTETQPRVHYFFGPPARQSKPCLRLYQGSASVCGRKLSEPSFRSHNNCPGASPSCPNDLGRKGRFLLRQRLLAPAWSCSIRYTQHHGHRRTPWAAQARAKCRPSGRTSQRTRYLLPHCIRACKFVGSGAHARGRCRSRSDLRG